MVRKKVRHFMVALGTLAAVLACLSHYALRTHGVTGYSIDGDIEKLGEAASELGADKTRWTRYRVSHCPAEGSTSDWQFHQTWEGDEQVLGEGNRLHFSSDSSLGHRPALGVFSLDRPIRTKVFPGFFYADSSTAQSPTNHLCAKIRTDERGLMSSLLSTTQEVRDEISLNFGDGSPLILSRVAEPQVFGDAHAYVASVPESEFDDRGQVLLDAYMNGETPWHSLRLETPTGVDAQLQTFQFSDNTELTVAWKRMPPFVHVRIHTLPNE